MVGGSIAITGQWLTINEARHIRSLDKLERDRTYAVAFLFKLAQIANNLHNIDKYFVLCLDETPRIRKLRGENWQFYKPTVYQPEKVRFLVEEIAVLLSNVHSETARKCLGLDEENNAVLDMLHSLNVLRDALTDSLHPSSVVGDIISGEMAITFKQRAQMNAINSLIEMTRSTCVADLARAKSAVAEVSLQFKQKLGLDFILSSGES